jgi:hypothetical protein
VFRLPKRPTFSGPAASGVPTAHTARARRRYAAMLRESADVLAHLPGPGESLHALMTGLYDFMTLVGHVITNRPAPCAELRIATLAFSSRNTHEIAQLLDGGAVKSVSLLCSDFFAKHNKAEFAEAVRELTERGQAIAAPRCHAKVTCLHFADGAKLVFEGSANLRTNGNIEQFALFTDPELHDWHAAWIDGKHREWQSDQAWWSGNGLRKSSACGSAAQSSTTYGNMRTPQRTRKASRASRGRFRHPAAALHRQGRRPVQGAVRQQGRSPARPPPAAASPALRPRVGVRGLEGGPRRPQGRGRTGGPLRPGYGRADQGT